MRRIRLFVSNLNWMLSNTSWQTVERIIYLCSVTYTSILCVKYIGPYYYGTISLYSNVLLFSLVMAKFGTDAIFYKDLKNINKKYWVGNLILMRTCTGVVINTAVLLFIIVFGEVDIRCLYYILAISIAMLIQGADVALLYNRANGLYRNDVMINIVTLLMSSLGKILIVHYRLSFALLSLPIIFEVLVPAVYRLYSGDAIKVQYVIKRRIILYFIRYGAINLIPNLALLINQRTVFFILAALGSRNMVAVYAVAFFISNAVFMLPNILTTTAVAKLSKVTDSTIRIAKTISVIRLLSLMLLIAIFISHYCGEYLIPMFLGEGYEKLNLIVTLILISFYFSSITKLSVKVIKRERYKYHYIISHILTFVVHITFTYLLALRYGIIGATCGFLFAEFFSATFASYIISKRIFLMHLKLFYNRS